MKLTLLMRLVTIATTFIIITNVVTTFVLAADKVEETVTANGVQDDNNNKNQCGLYLAVSTIMEDIDDDEDEDDEYYVPPVPKTKWGIYAGKEYPIDSYIGSAEIGINLHNFEAQSNVYHENYTQDDIYSTKELLEYYCSLFWVPDIIGAGYELLSKPGQTGNVAYPGMGLLSVDKAELTNAKVDTLESFRRTLVNSSTINVSHPNRGSYSQFNNQRTQAIKHIKAGQEIFLHAGHPNSLYDTKGTNLLSTKLSPNDITKIDELIIKIHTYFTKYISELADKDTRTTMYNFLIRDVLSAAVGSNKASRISHHLPEDPDELINIIQQGGIMSYSFKAGYQNITWLQQHGLCIDNIRSGLSTIPNIGHGAFATRQILENTLVAPAPVLLFPDSTIFNMYKLKKILVNVDDENDDDNDDDDESKIRYVRESEAIIGQQLLYNYVYGHPESTIVLLPTSPVVNYINHSPNPNAKMVWSKHYKHNNNNLYVDPEDELYDANIIESYDIVIEIIALRTIEVNEEIFINYGTEWINAYNNHTIEWENRISKDNDNNNDNTNDENENENANAIPKVWPMKAIDLNNKYNTTHFETEDEINKILEDENNSNKPYYPTNVELRAFIVTSGPDTGYTGSYNDPYIWNTDDLEEGSTPYITDQLIPITIIQRYESTTLSTKKTTTGTSSNFSLENTTYTVRCQPGKQTQYVKNVPHHAIIFIDRPGTSDNFIIKPFRHYIGIPDDIFPKGSWRNKPRKN